MPILNKFFIFSIFIFITACSNNKQQESIKEIPNAPDGLVDSTPDAHLLFSDFMEQSMLYFQAKDIKSLKNYINLYKPQFTKPQEKEEIQFLEAISFFLEKDYKKLEDSLNQLLKTQNKDLQGRVYFYLAQSSKAQKKYDTAIQLLKKSYQLYPSYEIYSSLGDTYAIKKDWKNAISFFQKSLKNNPQPQNEIFLLGAAYYQIKDYSAALKYMKKVLEKNPKDFLAYEYLGQISMEQNNMRDYYFYYSRALLLRKDYDNTIKLLNNEPLVYKDKDLSSFLLSSYVRTKQPVEALRVYNQAIKVSPNLKDDVDFKIYHGVLSIIPQGEKIAKEYFFKLAKQYPNNFLVITTYAEYLASLNKKDPLLESIYLQSLLIDPTDTANRYLLATFYQETNKLDLAQLEYGILHYYQDQKDLSLEALTVLENRNPDFKNVQLPLYMGLLYQEQGNIDKALEYYQKALKIDPQSKIASISIKKLADIQKKKI